MGREAAQNVRGLGLSSFGEHVPRRYAGEEGNRQERKPCNPEGWCGPGLTESEGGDGSQRQKAGNGHHPEQAIVVQLGRDRPCDRLGDQWVHQEENEPQAKDHAGQSSQRRRTRNKAPHQPQCICF